MSKKLIYLISLILALCLFQTRIANADDPSLVAWYRFDGNALDSSGNELHGKEIGNPTYEAGVFGQAIRLDGNGDYIDCGLAPEFDITDYITFTYWIKVIDFDKGWNTVLSKGDDSWRSARAAYNDFMEAAVTGTTGDYTYGVTPVNDGQWHHVGFVYDGRRNYLYVDGKRDASEPSTGKINVSSYPLWIGGNAQWPGGWWNGLIDDVRIYNRALSQEEIQIIMQGSTGEYLQASNPTPADGDLYAYTWVNLNWRAGDLAVSHDVYFGEDFDDVKDGTEEAFRGNQAESFFVAGLPGFSYPNGLIPGTTYYWRIDEVNDLHPDSPWKGNVWSFLVPSEITYTPGRFEITYYDNYNYDTGRWDAWQSTETPRDAWDDKYLADESYGKTVFTDHAFTSIDVFDLKGSLFSKDGHESWGEDWNPLKSIGDTVSMQSPHHVFAALFKGLVYLKEGDILAVSSDDDAYVFLDDDASWGQEVLSVPFIHYFETESMIVTAAQAGYHTMTVKFIERQNDHSGIEITLNGVPIRSVELPGIEDFETGDFSKYSWMPDSNWIISQSEKYSGDYSAEAGAIGDNESTALEITLDCAQGSITFYRKVSSETDFDYLKFYIDGEKQEAWSGEEDWAKVSFQVEEGTRTNKWTYSKDDSGSEGDDTAWIDDIVFPLKSSRSEPPDSLEGFDVYRDSIAPNIINTSWFDTGILDFYCQDNPASGNYCIHWGGVGQYASIPFRFLPIKDLSVLVDEGFAVDFWVRCDEPSAKIDIGFVDTKTGDRTDHPWRMRYMIDQNVARWDGQWNHLQIPLNTFYEGGSWDDDHYIGPIGAFDWTATEYFEIIAEYLDLVGIDFYFDEIRIVECF